MTGSGPHYWFRPRRYGHGASPTTWQGWATIVAFPFVVGLVVLALFWVLPEVLGVVAVLISLPAAVFAFIAFIRKKTDGEWRWRWGAES